MSTAWVAVGVRSTAMRRRRLGLLLGDLLGSRKGVDPLGGRALLRRREDGPHLVRGALRGLHRIAAALVDDLVAPRLGGGQPGEHGRQLGGHVRHPVGRHAGHPSRSGGAGRKEPAQQIRCARHRPASFHGRLVPPSRVARVPTRA